MIDNIINKIKTLEWQLRNTQNLPDEEPKEALEKSLEQIDSIKASISRVITEELGSHSNVPSNLRYGDIPSNMRCAISNLSMANRELDNIKKAIDNSIAEFSPLLWQEYDYSSLDMYMNDFPLIKRHLEEAKAEVY